MRTRKLILAALTVVAFVAAPHARAGEEVPAEAARRMAASFLKQLETRPPRPPVTAVAISPLREPPGGRGRELCDALGAALATSGRLAVRRWDDLEHGLAEKVRDGALSGSLALPPVPAIQAMVVGEATPMADGRTRVQIRLVSVPGGAALAADSATLTPAPASVVAAPAASAAPVPGASRAPVESASVEIAMRRMADALAAGFGKLPGNARYRRLAVMDFTETGAEAKRREMGRVVSAELSTNLRRDHGLLLVERARLGAVLGEMKLAEMGLVDAKQAPKIGQLADAQALVIGTVAEAGDRFLVTARIVSADGAETLAAASEPIAAASLVALSSDAVVLRTRKDAAFRSMVVPGWGQLYNRQGGKAAVFAGTEALLLGGALSFHLLGMQAEDQYKTQTTAGDLGGNPYDAAADLRHRAENNYRLRNYLLAGALGVWALNVADAWYSGVDGEAMLALTPITGGGGTIGLAAVGTF